MKRTLLTMALCAVLFVPGVYAADDIVVADFEGDTYGDWAVEGKAFGRGPAKGTLPSQRTVAGYLGVGLANSHAGG